MKYFFVILFALFFITPLNSQGEEYPPMPSDPNEKIEWLKGILGDFEVIESQPQDILIMGRVIDQNNDPVVGAEVEVSWAYNTALLEKKVNELIITTDAGENFYFEAPDHVEPLIRTVRKKGYEFNKKANPFFTLSSEAENAALFNSQNDPVELNLRKLGETSYLYHEQDFSVHFKLLNHFVTYNAFKRGLKEIDRDLSKLQKPEAIDLIFDVIRDTENQQYTFRFIAPLNSNGVLLHDNNLYTAPSDGYTTELSITLNHGEEIKKYLYFKSRNLEYDAGANKEYKPIYSRMGIELRARDDRLIFFFDTWTNPYGSPNLEYEPDMPFDLRNELCLEAKETIKSGKLPPEPNLQEMMASGQYN